MGQAGGRWRVRCGPLRGRRTRNLKLKVSVTVFRESKAARFVSLAMTAIVFAPSSRNIPIRLGLTGSLESPLLDNATSSLETTAKPPLDLDSHDLSALAMKDARAPQDFTAPA
jgi:hypothetical protein